MIEMSGSLFIHRPFNVDRVITRGLLKGKFPVHGSKAVTCISYLFATPTSFKDSILQPKQSCFHKMNLILHIYQNTKLILGFKR
ncbi:hypothetical protein HanXRQr2_Chr09g0368381 [Helianthus annuus]|uniref:Uncharacterized protein n=1 Tax=Helianthus annuus TaxID=4232 RepID=A0A251TRP5_HELAN|nr:hypothetical protein HanXRQr2_Chr09g0368381 [Helianthus annuus]